MLDPRLAKSICRRIARLSPDEFDDFIGCLEEYIEGKDDEVLDEAVEIVVGDDDV